MSDEHLTFRSLLRQMQDGSHEAAWTIVQTYSPQVQAVIRRQMSKRLRSLYDSEDFVQSVWASFLRAQPSSTIDGPKQLIALLSKMAKNRIIDEARKRKKTIKHGRHVEVQIRKDCGEAFLLPDPSPTPSAHLIAQEAWDQLFADVPDYYRVIVERRVEGATFTEIATQLGKNERTIRRVIKTIRDKYTEANQATSAEGGDG